MSAIEIKITNLNRLTDLAEKYPKTAEKHIGGAINKSLVRIFAEEKQTAPFGVTANLRDNWLLSFGRFQGSLRSNAPYSVGIEEGTRPHYVSPRALKPWAEARGLNPFAVAKSIAKKGTKANPFLKRAVDNTADAVDREFTKALDALVDDLAKGV
jgi:hypothetical protein